MVAAVAPLCRPHATALIDAIRENQQRFAGLLADALAEAEAEA